MKIFYKISLWILLFFYIHQSFGLSLKNTEIQTYLTGKPKFKRGQNKEIILTYPKGSRPNPSNYLKKRYIKRHLRPFRRQASFLIPGDILDKYGRNILGRADGQFVMSGKEMNKLLRKAKGDISFLEYELGIPNQSWHHRKIIRIDIDKPEPLHLRLPSGNEDGANELWIPGGKLPNGYKESVIDQIPMGKYKESVLDIRK